MKKNFEKESCYDRLWYFLDLFRIEEIVLIYCDTLRTIDAKRILKTEDTLFKKVKQKVKMIELGEEKDEDLIDKYDKRKKDFHALAYRIGREDAIIPYCKTIIEILRTRETKKIYDDNIRRLKKAEKYFTERNGSPVLNYDEFKAFFYEVVLNEEKKIYSAINNNQYGEKYQELIERIVRFQRTVKMEEKESYWWANKILDSYITTLRLKNLNEKYNASRLSMDAKLIGEGEKGARLRKKAISIFKNNKKGFPDFFTNIVNEELLWKNFVNIIEYYSLKNTKAPRRETLVLRINKVENIWWKTFLTNQEKNNASTLTDVLLDLQCELAEKRYEYKYILEFGDLTDDVKYAFFCETVSRIDKRNEQEINLLRYFYEKHEIISKLKQSHYYLLYICACYNIKIINQIEKNGTLSFYNEENEMIAEKVF